MCIENMVRLLFSWKFFGSFVKRKKSFLFMDWWEKWRSEIKKRKWFRKFHKKNDRKWYIWGEYYIIMKPTFTIKLTTFSRDIFFFFPVTVSSLFVLCIQYLRAYRYDSHSVIHITFLNSITWHCYKSKVGISQLLYTVVTKI